MPESASAELRNVLPNFTAPAARELAAELDKEADVLKRRARALHAFADTMDSLGPDVEPVDGRSGEPGDDGHGRRSKPSAPPSNKRPLIVGLVRERPMPGWSPAQIRDTLIERGAIPPETSKPAIGVTVRRMFEGGELVKTEDGLYTLPGEDQQMTIRPGGGGRTERGRGNGR